MKGHLLHADLTLMAEEVVSYNDVRTVIALNSSEFTILKLFIILWIYV